MLNRKLKKLLLAGAALTLATSAASAKDLKSIGVTLGSLGNPFFVAMTKGIQDQAGSGVKVVSVSADYDLGKQSTQVDNFIASGVDLILLNAADPSAIAPAVKRAQAAGIPVIAVDVTAAGADATVQTDNVKAGEISCQYMADRIGQKGNVVIQNSNQVSAVIDRVKGCKNALAGHPGIKILSDDQNGEGSRDGGLKVMQGYLTRFQDLQGVFCINDPQAIGSDLAAKQLGRRNIVITSVDGAPDIVKAIKSDTLVQASASQDPYKMGQMAVEIGQGLLNGKKPENPTILLAPQLITRDNVDQYKGWTSH